ncbi:hypothetical protein HN51_017845 [Arachis hypogaea]|uniref:Uncharacterized protein n=2 Tax=Arachis hypogaea TaxID=3818 RepID=A0A445BRE5_ARAHY|nr:EC protein homolog [Arachis hypogaea]RYR41228.1 hypothetical protein Ahy_A08g037626 [Arachis hypogaea]
MISLKICIKRQHRVFSKRQKIFERDSNMADKAMKGGARCNDRCGCSIPCPGDSTCRCASGSEGGGETQHLTCPCGEHCECNPCTCPKTFAAGAGCKCGPGCSCASCRRA